MRRCSWPIVMELSKMKEMSYKGIDSLISFDNSYLFFCILDLVLIVIELFFNFVKQWMTPGNYRNTERYLS